MTLLQKLQSALNKIYDGNTLTREEHEKDLYYCPRCEDYVTEDRFNHRHNCCFFCHYNSGDNDAGIGRLRKWFKHGSHWNQLPRETRNILRNISGN